MSKIIKITAGYKTTEAYKKSISNAISELEEVELSLVNMIVNLSTAGKWKAWSDGQPVGTIFEFTEEMLRDTEDENVQAIFKVRDKILELMNELSDG